MKANKVFSLHELFEIKDRVLNGEITFDYNEARMKSNILISSIASNASLDSIKTKQTKDPCSHFLSS